MSEQCKLYCPNFNECNTRLNEAVDEGRLLDNQEAAWTREQAELPVRDIEQQLVVTGLEFDATLGDLGTDFIGAASTTITENKALEAAQTAHQQTIDRYAIVDTTLDELRDRQRQNNADITALAEGTAIVSDAAAKCDGPKLSVAGKIRVWGDMASGNETVHQGLYLAKYAKCGSKIVSTTVASMPVPTRQYYPARPE